jgi:exopolyphosphatase / guanosine-5'-triphosphate,3'-diphosphate pyrophosphatase
MRLATIDVGTNTTLLLVAEAGPAGVRELASRTEITRLGRGIGGEGGAGVGRLGPEGVARTLEALRQLAALARAHEAEIAAIGTEALRRAPNAADFLDPAAEILGVPIEVIDGEREAALAFLATERSFPREAEGELVVVDIGGGSTEVILGVGGTMRFRTSVPIGSVRMTERHVRGDPPTEAEVLALEAAIEEALDGAGLSAALATAASAPGSSPAGNAAPAATFVGVAGTVTTLAAMARGLPGEDPTLVHGAELPLGALEAQVARLRGASLAERRVMKGLDPRRADVILAGACILTAVARRAGARSVLVSDRGIRWGLLYERLARAGL